jgi:hypothetical protein
MPNDLADADVSELNPAESPQAAARLAHNQEVLAKLQVPLLELEKAFVALQTAKRNEAELERDFQAAQNEEAILLTDQGPEKEVVRRLVNLRAVKDVRASRLAAGREQIAEQRDFVLELGLVVRKSFSNAAHQLLKTRQDRILALLGDLIPLPSVHGLPIDNRTLMLISKPVAELQNFTNTVVREPAPTIERELAELSQWPRRWFERIAELVQIESEFKSFPAEQTSAEVT